MQKELSQEEIDAMVQAARGGGAGIRSQTAAPVAPWDVRQAGQIGRDQMRSISQLHEIFARNLTNSIGAYLRILFDCSLVSAEHLTYRDYLQSIPENAYLASCDLSPVGVVAVLQVDLAIAFPIIDLLLGGEGKGGDLGRAITDIEEQVLESILRIICRELQTTWQAISLTFEFGQRQPVSQAQRLMPPDGKKLMPELRSQDAGNPRYPEPCRSGGGIQRAVTKNLGRLQLSTAQGGKRSTQPDPGKTTSVPLPSGTLPSPSAVAVADAGGSEARRTAVIFEERFRSSSSADR